MLSNHPVVPGHRHVVLVQKKDGTSRFSVDYCKVNTVTRKDTYPLPRVDDFWIPWLDPGCLVPWI